MNRIRIISQAKFLSVAALTLLLAAGCTTEHEEVESLPQPLAFSTSVHAPTRAAGDLTTDNLASVGLFASFTQGNYNASTATLNFMHNQKLQKSGSAWTYSPQKYWPVNANDKISFFAYAPHLDEIKANGDDITEMPTTTTAGYPAFTFVNSAAKTDLLLAVPVLNKNGGNVSLAFKHALTRVSFYIKNGDVTGGKKVHSFSIQSRKSGKYTLNETGFAYSMVGSDMRDDATVTAPIDVPQNTTDKVLLKTLFVHPDAETNFSMIYSINGSDANKVEVVSQKLSATLALTSGANISYTISLNKDGYTIKAANETEWTQGGGKNITCYGANHLKMGDYYYSDGTTSDGGIRAIDMDTEEITLADPLPAPVAGKTCVGIVYYLGKHPTDDCTYTTIGGGAMNTVNGYVVSLSNLGEAYSIGGWIPFSGSTAGRYLVGTSTNVDDYRGYSNTHLIRTTAEGKGIWNTTNFHLPYRVLNEFNVSVPQSCSGWYMPSAGQLKYLYKYRKILRDVMAKVGNYTMTGDNDGWYWSSTELNSDRAYMMQGFNGDAGAINTYIKEGRDGTRPVLTF